MLKSTFSVMCLWIIQLIQTNSIAQPIHFNLVKEVQVTPSADYLNADFVRIGYVPGRDRFIVTFNTMVSDPGLCSESFDEFYKLYRVYAYKEYTADMEETGKDSIVSCHGTTDTGGCLLGDDFFLASAKIQDTIEGWNLAKFNVVTWAKLAEYYYPLTDHSWHASDPTVALANGQIDINAGKDGLGTHHHFFTTALQFVNQLVLSDTDHIGFSSMITQGGINYFLSSKPGVPWSAIVMKYDMNWTYLGMKTLRDNAATPQGLAFDGTLFYVAYTERSDGFPFVENVHLAAFDTNWSLIGDVPLTNFTLQDQKSSIHPFLALRNNRLYVSYCQNAPAGGIETLQAYVKVYEIINLGMERNESLQYFLKQNHPNPFNSNTLINYQIPVAGHVVLVVYNVFGREVRTLVNENQKAGPYSITFNADNLPDGAYMYCIQTSTFTETKKLIIVK
jgi:hypothetical protein